MNKNEKNAFVLSKEKKKFKKEYVGIIIAVIVLIVLLFILVKELFFTKKYQVIVPPLPNYKDVDLGVVDPKDSGNDINNIESKKVSKKNISYKIISDYYKKGIVLGNTKINMHGDKFYITSGISSPNAFVSSVTIDGKLEWIYKIEEKKYKTIDIYQTRFIKDLVYVFASATDSNDKKQTILITVNQKGEKEDLLEIEKDKEIRILDVKNQDSKIALIASDYTGDIKVYSIPNTKTVDNNVYSINSNYPNIDAKYVNSNLEKEKLSLIVKTDNGIEEITINNSDNSSDRKTFDGVNELQIEDSIYSTSYEKGYIFNTKNSIYKFDEQNRLENKNEYSKLKLENLDDIKEKYKDDEYMDVENLTNYIEINKITVDKNILVEFETLLTRAYDIYDSEFNLINRFTVDKEKYEIEEGILLASYYHNGSIYEIYSYGTKTPSIMISKIG